jgi:ribosome maturation factor RimP
MSKIDALIVDIQRLAGLVADQVGLEIVEVKVHPHNDLMHVQIFADTPEGGIGMEACADLNRRLVVKLDSELFCGDNYTLEVSSPGLDRLLTGYRDLRRALGRDVQVFLRRPLNDKREFSGVLLAVREAEIILGSRKGEILIAMDNMEKAKQIIK